MADAEIIRVPERGDVPIPSSSWERLRSDARFQALVTRGIVDASLGPDGQWRLRGSCYVGRAMCGQVVIEVHEKTPGALAALIGYASREAFRIEPARSAAGDLSYLIALLVHQFLVGVRRYASRGRKFEYSRRSQVASLAGGKLDMTRTIQLRARGLGHMLAFHKSVATHDVEVNRLVLAALQEVGCLATLVELPAGDVADARGLAMLFSDCLGSSLLRAPRGTLVERAHAAASDVSLDEDTRDIVELAAVLMSHEGFGESATSGQTVPRAWFINLEALFQRAILECMSDAAGPMVGVTAGPTPAPQMFVGGVDARGVYPDLVLDSTEGRTVGDVKYKTWDRKAKRADLYQVLLHAVALDADRAFLVYPGSGFDSVYLGRAVTGAETWLFCVDVTHLEADLRSAVHLLELPNSRLQACL